MTFLGINYTLNQCEDFFKWLTSSKVGEFTLVYDKVVFNTTDGFVAAYTNDLDNYWRI